MANIRTRETASGPRYDVKFTFNGEHRMKTFRTFDDARAYKKKMEGEQLAGLVVDPKGGERLFGPLCRLLARAAPRQGPSTDTGHPSGVPGRAAATPASPSSVATKLRQITPERVRRWHAEFSLVSP